MVLVQNKMKRGLDFIKSRSAKARSRTFQTELLLDLLSHTDSKSIMHYRGVSQLSDSLLFSRKSKPPAEKSQSIMKETVYRGLYCLHFNSALSPPSLCACETHQTQSCSSS